MYRLRRAGWRINRAFLKLGKAASHHWWTSVRKLRAELGLRTQCDPVFRDKFAPELVLALFSKVLAQPQPDWPRQTIQPGFLFYDKSSTEEPADRLQQFFSAGSPPLVFTQGSTAVHHPGSFYENSVRAARMLGRHALLIGTQQHAEGDNVLAVPYASYAAVFPEAAAIVHQGGSGTTGQALRAGRPQLIVPFGWDQPDNAARVERLGAGLSLARVAYTPAAAADALKRLLSEDRFRIAAEAARNEVRDTPALAIASDAIEALLSRCPKGD